MVNSNKKGDSGSKETGFEDLSKERLSLKSRLGTDIDNFLKAGGQVTKAEKDLRTDLPKRPSMSYGTTPI